MLSRRDLAKIALGAIPAVRLLAKPNSMIRGVTIGVQSRSFRDRSVDDALAAMDRVGISECELWEGHAAPPRLNRKGEREWRENIAIEQFQLIYSNFDRAGVKIHAYNYDFEEDFSERETERGFEMAKALKADVITTSSPVALVRKLNAGAARAGMFVCLRNREGLSTADELAAAIRGSSNLGIGLDIGDFSAAGQDPLRFISTHADRIFVIYLKDRKRDGGESVPFGRGDTPIAATLRLIQSRKLRIPAMIDYDYAGTDPVAEVDRCLEFCRGILTSKAPVPAASPSPRTIIRK